MFRALAGSALPIAALALTAAAQTPPFLPHSDLYITDSSNDRLLRLRDLNYDGDHNDAGESIIFYDDVTGGYLLSNNNGIISAPDGAVYVGDSSEDHVLWLKDLDGNGDALGINESRQFFLSVQNAMAIEMASAADMDLEGGVLWVAVAQGGSTGKDYILRLEDLNADGDAQDLNESLEYCVRYTMGTSGTAAGASIPADVQVGLDGNVYYLETGSTGYYPKGVYRLVDSDANGTIDPGEVSTFFTFPTTPSTPFPWSIEQGPDGWWYSPDTGQDKVYRFKDLNNDGDALDAGESSAWWTSPGASLIWDCRWGRDGNLYVSESQNNERLFVFRDTDGDGVIDPVNEAKVFYDELVTQGPAIGQIRGFVLDQVYQDAYGTTYCTAQTNTLGCVGSMTVNGWASATYPTGCMLSATNVRNLQNGVFFYGLNGRQATPFHGGTMCLASPKNRMGVLNSGGSLVGSDCTGAFLVDFNAWAAGGNDPLLVVGVVVDAQCWSRDPGSPSGNTNVTDAVEFTIVR